LCVYSKADIVFSATKKWDKWKLHL
jgi:hypothetical protein